MVRQLRFDRLRPFASVHEIAIYTDDDGLPGVALLIRKVGSADQTAIGNDQYSYSVTFPSKTLTPGTAYLFGVYVTAASEPTWGMSRRPKRRPVRPQLVLT